jgi:hypothetical protein
MVAEKVVLGGSLFAVEIERQKHQAGKINPHDCPI